MCCIVIYSHSGRKFARTKTVIATVRVKKLLAMIPWFIGKTLVRTNSCCEYQSSNQNKTLLSLFIKAEHTMLSLAINT